MGISRLKFRCFQCHQLLGAPPSKYGKEIPCPRCGIELIVPDPFEPFSAERGEDADDEENAVVQESLTQSARHLPSAAAEDAPRFAVPRYPNSHSHVHAQPAPAPAPSVAASPKETASEASSGRWTEKGTEQELPLPNFVELAESVRKAPETATEMMMPTLSAAMANRENPAPDAPAAPQRNAPASAPAPAPVIVNKALRITSASAPRANAGDVRGALSPSAAVWEAPRREESDNRPAVRTSRRTDVIVPRFAITAWAIFGLISLVSAFLSGLLVGHFLWRS